MTFYTVECLNKYSILAPSGIGKLVRLEVTWGEILQQRRFDSRVGQIFTEILWGSVLGVGLLALSLKSLPLVHIPRFTTRLVNGPLAQEIVNRAVFGSWELSFERYPTVKICSEARQPQMLSNHTHCGCRAVSATTDIVVAEHVKHLGNHNVVAEMLGNHRATTVSMKNKKSKK
ncbi:Uncharacterized protein Fot_55153 [Forsythia ovata]|uniref:Uncharacterized protein n=1 Tax=Forsythia ovata TaxID=205694 RepID=A0ABD1P5H1_9LAMI